MSKRFNHVIRSLGAASGAAFLIMLVNLMAAPSRAAEPGRLSAGSLVFGMSPEAAARSLGVPLTYVRGRPGDELFLAIPNVKGSALSMRSDGLYLQFRHWRLSGWKGDWGTVKPWVVGW